MDNQDRLGSVVESIAGKQFSQAVDQAAQSTSISLDSTGGIMLMTAFIIFAIAGLIKQARPLAQPFADVTAEGIRQARQGQKKELKRAAKIADLEKQLKLLKAESEIADQ